MSDLYSRIEALCEIKGVNITQMCKESGVSRASMTDLKVGRNQGLSPRTLSKVAAYFEVSVDFLLGNEQKEKAVIDVVDDDLQEYLDELRNRPEKRLLFSVTKHATKSQIEAIVKMIEEMQGAGDGQ